MDPEERKELLERQGKMMSLGSSVQDMDLGGG